MLEINQQIGHLISPQVAVRSFQTSTRKREDLHKLVLRGRRNLISSALRRYGAVVTDEGDWFLPVIPDWMYHVEATK